MDGKTIVDRITPRMIDREPETIAEWIDAAIAQAKAEEREACALICDDHMCGCGDHATDAARRIRERGPDDQRFVNARWLIAQFDALHDLVCPDRLGTWQQRIEQVIDTIRARTQP